MSAQAQRLSLGSKMAFGVGGLAEIIVLGAGQGAAMFYYNQVHGLPGHLAGLAIGASLIVDGLMDPLVGSWSDRTRTKWGRRHPYMYASGLPTAIAFFCLFSPPGGLGQTGLFLWLAVTSLVMRIFLSLFHVPHLALGGEMSADYADRSRIMSWYNFSTFLGGVVMTLVSNTFFFVKTPQFHNGQLNPAAYPPYALCWSIVVFFVLMGSSLLTHDQIRKIETPPPQPKMSLDAFWKDTVMAFSNVNLIWLLVPAIFMSITSGMRGGLLLYTNFYIFEITPQTARWLTLGSAIGFIFTMLGVARLHNRFDKGPVMVVCSLVFAVAPVLPQTLRLMGLFWENGSPMLLPSIIVCHVLGGIGYSIFGISIMSAMADVADENERRFGVRQQGMLYATRSLTAKVEQAMGAMAAGLALSLIHFPKHAKPGNVSQVVVDNLAFAAGPVTIAIPLIAALLYTQYKVTKASHADTKAWLEAKRASAKAAAEASPAE